MAAVVLVHVWQQFGFSFLLFVGGLANIPRELHEAAAMDGATGLRKHSAHHALAALPHAARRLGRPASSTPSRSSSSRTSSPTADPATRPDRGDGPLPDRLRAAALREASAIGVVLFALVLAVTALQFRLSRRFVHYQCRGPRTMTSVSVLLPSPASSPSSSAAARAGRGADRTPARHHRAGRGSARRRAADRRAGAVDGLHLTALPAQSFDLPPRILPTGGTLAAYRQVFDQLDALAAGAQLRAGDRSDRGRPDDHGGARRLRLRPPGLPLQTTAVPGLVLATS